MSRRPQRPPHASWREAEPSSHRPGPVILVPLDGSSEAKAILPAARLIGRVTRASIHLVHVSDRRLSEEELLRRLNLRREETHSAVIDQAIGTPAQGIVHVAEEEQAALIAMTTRGQTAYEGRTVRPVVEQVVQKAPCPVLLARPEASRRVAATKELRRILLPLDGAPTSAAVIGPALDLGERSGAEVDMLYVATESGRPKERGTLTVPRYMDQPQYEWPAWTREFVSRFGTSLGRYRLPATMRMFQRSGEPAAEILCFAVEHDSDLIVLEWRGRLDPAHAAVVRGVLSEAPCPVMLLRMQAYTSVMKVKGAEWPRRPTMPS